MHPTQSMIVLTCYVFRSKKSRRTREQNCGILSSCGQQITLFVWKSRCTELTRRGNLAWADVIRCKSILAPDKSLEAAGGAGGTRKPSSGVIVYGHIFEYLDASGKQFVSIEELEHITNWPFSRTGTDKIGASSWSRNFTLTTLGKIKSQCIN